MRSLGGAPDVEAPGVGALVGTAELVGAPEVGAPVVGAFVGAAEHEHSQFGVGSGGPPAIHAPVELRASLSIFVKLFDTQGSFPLTSLYSICLLTNVFSIQKHAFGAFGSSLQPFGANAHTTRT
eukprot:CAMPEP_0203803270 /NCGR_PEP_ID=MMETSP0100_2-20121128/12719_1 /ASSEMBLY_ACC=CAM_ASM_000210 /TAXON_ID=96639 /ORGANISM=" , Strain NY0313808BC1" /LENGTH=123 /DNA_ID=CAMNT_0050710925 /DNA_START=86 /DNA_END=458 /DNA_ORIENTATION=+